MNKKKLSILSIILYVLAALLMIFAIWSLINAITYISMMISQGQLAFSGNEFDIISFIMTSCALYVIFAVILLALGLILQRCTFSVCSTSNDEVIDEPITSSEKISEDNTTDETLEDY